MSRKAKILNVRPADENHQVVTTSRENKDSYRRQPCEQCPWRKDSPVGAFPAEAYRHSANTAYDMSEHQFGCHMSGTTKPATCAGYMLAGSENNLAHRLDLAFGRVDMRQVSDGGHELYASYREMAEANGVEPDDPILAPCRD